MCECPWRFVGSFVTLGTGITGSCEPCNVGAGIPTWVLSSVKVVILGVVFPVIISFLLFCFFSNVIVRSLSVDLVDDNVLLQCRNVKFVKSGVVFKAIDMLAGRKSQGQSSGKIPKI